MAKKLLLIIMLLVTRSSGFSQSPERYKKLQDTLIVSNDLGYQKHLSITVPRDYQEGLNQKYPLILIFDTQNKRSYNYLLNTIDYLTSNEQMPASIIVGIESEPDKRWKETSLPITDEASLGKKNEAFIFNELIPLAKQKYKASDFTTLIGHSRYGYFTTYLLTQRPSSLNAVVSISPFFKQANVDLADSLGKISSGAHLEHTVYYRYSAGADFPEDFDLMENSLTGAKDSQINSKGYLFPEADHNVTPGLTVGKALYEIFQYWRSQQNRYISENNKDLEIRKDLDAKITEHYGQPLNFSLGILNGKGWQFFNEKQFSKAINAWNLMLEVYPNFSEGYLAILEAQKSSGMSVDETVRLFNESVRKSLFYEDSEKAELLKELESLTK